MCFLLTLIIIKILINWSFWRLLDVFLLFQRNSSLLKEFWNEEEKSLTFEPGIYDEPT